MFSEYFAADMVSLLSVQVDYQYSTPSILTIIPMLGLLFPDQADYFARYLLNRAFTTMVFDDDTELAYALYDASKLNSKRGSMTLSSEQESRKFLARCALSCFDIPMIPYLSAKKLHISCPNHYSLETINYCHYITALALASPHWHIAKIVKSFKQQHGYDIFEFALPRQGTSSVEILFNEILNGIDNDKISQLYMVGDPFGAIQIKYDHRLYRYLKVNWLSNQPKYQKDIPIRQILTMFKDFDNPRLVFLLMTWQDKYQFNIRTVLKIFSQLGVLTNDTIFKYEHDMQSIIQQRQPFSPRDTAYCQKKIPRFMEWLEFKKIPRISIVNHAILWRFFRGVLDHHEQTFLFMNANKLFHDFHEMSRQLFVGSHEDILSAKTLVYAFIFVMRLQDTLFAPPVGIEQSLYHNLCSWLGVDGTGNGQEYDYKKYISAEISPRQQPHICSCLDCKK